MDILLRELQTGADGIAEYHDVEFSGAEVAIGSAPDAAIQLLGIGVAGRHAVVRRSGERIELRCGRGSHARLNGRECVNSQVVVGDLIEIAGNKLKIAKAPTGFDFAIEIQPDPTVDSSAFEQAFRTDLSQAGLSKRRLAWLSLLVVVLLGFAVPLAGVMIRGEQTSASRWLPSDRFWSTGDLLPAHAQATDQGCNHCHEKLFVQVRDNACLQCHKGIANHVTDAHAKLIDAPAQRCASCHREHGESHEQIIVRTDQLCTSCHSKAETRFAALKMHNAEAFEPNEHPEFAVSLLVPASIGQGAVTWQTSKIPQAGARDQSNLKFSHRQHLDAEKVTRRTDGAAMECGDCHRPNSDGLQFAPMTMQTTCASCHELNFDPSAPERQLPHAKPREAILVLQEYFARKYTDPDAAPTTRERRRLPGREAESVACTGSALTCARQRAAEEIEMQFTGRGCVTCHAVTDTKSADTYDRFQVLPVRLSQDFFAGTNFNHAAHSIQGNLTGDAACKSCHAVSKSEISSDLAMPNQSNCMECHRSNPNGEQIVSHCVDCHGYHPRRDAIVNSNSNITATASPPTPVP